MALGVDQVQLSGLLLDTMISFSNLRLVSLYVFSSFRLALFGNLLQLQELAKNGVSTVDRADVARVLVHALTSSKEVYSEMCMFLVLLYILVS